ncbi:MAG: hypothetical protein ABWY57_15830 [Mycetocola sp.]
MTADQEHEMTGRDWAEEFLSKPIPAEKHQLHGEPLNPGVDLVKAGRIEGWIIAGAVSALSALSVGAIALYLTGWTL